MLTNENKYHCLNTAPTTLPTSHCNNKTCLQWKTEHNSDSEKTTRKHTEQLDLCHHWQQTNH